MLSGLFSSTATETWLQIGGLLFIIEALSMSGYFLILAICTAVAAGVAKLGFGLPIQIATFCVCCITLSALLWRFKPTKGKEIDPEIDLIGGHLIGREVEITKYDGVHCHFTIDEAPRKGTCNDVITEGDKAKIINVKHGTFELEKI
ncbi:hypothetical protein F7U66_01620 [Vibrio parahaemolyticus]|nr:hypothetical protein [Vibrio parahaemolyticus]